MKQLIRYSAVGLVSNLTIYFVYLLITYFGFGSKTSMTLIYVIGAIVGFFGNRKWTFTHHGESLSKAIPYFLVHLIGYLINFLILYTFVDRLGYAHQLVQAVAIIIVAGFIFVLLKFLVFNRKIYT